MRYRVTVYCYEDFEAEDEFHAEEQMIHLMHNYDINTWDWEFKVEPSKKYYWVTKSYTDMVEAENKEEAITVFDKTVNLDKCGHSYDVEED